MLTPLDIHNKEFKKSFRGYNEDDVDEFLDLIVKDYELLHQKSLELKETVDRVNSKLEHYQHIENTLHNTLVIAQETAEDVKMNAKKESELQLKEGQAQAQRLIDAAEDRVKQINAEFEEIKKQYELYKTQTRMLAEAQIELLNKDWHNDCVQTDK